MAHFFRLIFLLLLFLFSTAHAAIAPTSQYSCNASPVGRSHVQATGSTPSDCALGVYNLGVSQGWTAPVSCPQVIYGSGGVGSTYGWFWQCSNGGQVYISGLSSVCPANSALIGGSCVCGSDYVEDGSSCVPAPNEQQSLCNALKGTEVYGSIPGNHSPGSTSCNVLGCSATLAGTVLRVKDASGQYVTEGALTFTDQVCTYSADSGSVEDSCPGGASGELNGVTVCVPYDPNMNTIESVKASTSTTANGSGTVSTVTTTNTTCTNGSCNSTSTTVVNNNGTPSTETKTTIEPQTDYCAKNPNDPQCTNKGSFSGACAAGFTCTGDAVQCAIARELHAQNCKLNAISTESAIYDASKGKSGNQTTDLPGNEAHTFGPATFDQTDALGGGSCISDLSIEVLGKSVTLPTSKVCPYLLWLRSALLAIGAILWLVFVFRA